MAPLFFLKNKKKVFIFIKFFAYKVDTYNIKENPNKKEKENEI